MLSLLFLLFFNTQANAGVKKKIIKKGVVKAMTVLEVAEPVKGEDFYSVSFQISQRVYKLPVKGSTNYLLLLRKSEKQHKPVLVRRAKEESDVITGVEPIK